MKFESMPSGTPLPKENTLPLRVGESKKGPEHGDSTLWKVVAQDPEGLGKMIALKQVKREEFATPEAMRTDKEFYEFLKSFPDFGKFLPGTMYFKAQMTKDAAPQFFRLQRFIEGRAVDRMTDDELYCDPAVVRQLLELIDGALEILRAAREAKKLMPDFRHAIESNESLRTKIRGLLSDPRYSGNIFVSEKPDESGQRVFFVDTGPNAKDRTRKGHEIFVREISSRIGETSFKHWKKELEKALKNAPKD
jgi:hypothetical protein